MSKTPNYYIVEADALPEIFRKVVEARRMLDTGGGRNGQPGGPAHGDQPQRVFINTRTSCPRFRTCRAAIS